MILILGGTTEGRIAARTLEEAGKPFYYSTKGDEQEVTMHHGIRLQAPWTNWTWNTVAGNITSITGRRRPPLCHTTAPERRESSPYPEPACHPIRTYLSATR